MKRFIFTVLIIGVAFLTKPLWEEPVREIIPESVSNSFRSMREFTLDLVDDYFQLDQIEAPFSAPDSAEQESVERPELTRPDAQTFSIGNIELGDVKDEVEQSYGVAQRESMNEYGLTWSTYHENYHNFMMVAYDQDEVVRGLFTNQALLASHDGIELGDQKKKINETLGEPETLLHYETFSYQIDSDGEYDIYQIDDSYVTFFYDRHADDQLTAIQLIAAPLETEKEELYTSGSAELQAGFEYQLFDLTNATRVNHGLTSLAWADDVRETARNHSTDMAENHFFSHTNLDNATFSDRMLEDEIAFTVAGENLAYGQFSSIFAHQGLMNSVEHRENIVHAGFAKLGVGVDFNESNQPYFTENFLADTLNDE